MKKFVIAIAVIAVIAASWTAAVLTIIHAHKVWGFTVADWGGMLLSAGLAIKILLFFNTRKKENEHRP